MRGVNKVILVGNLGKDPEVKYLPNGTAVANVSIATNEEWKDKTTGEKQNRIEWHNLTFWGRLAEIAGEYLKKGATIYVEGSLRTEKWQDKEGKDRYTTKINVAELQMLSRPNGDSQQTGNQRRSRAPAQQAASGNDSFDDDIPF